MKFHPLFKRRNAPLSTHCQQNFFSSLIYLFYQWAVIWVHWFDPQLYTQLFSSRGTSPCFNSLSRKYRSQLEINAKFWGGKNENQNKFNEQFSEKCTSGSVEKMYSIQNTKVYQNVRRLVRWYLHLLSYAYNFCMENKTSNVKILVVKIYVINNHFLIKYKVQFNSVYWPINDPQGATGKLYIDE